ncbi:MAG: hypothetical protein IPH18_01780 [Chitinophagaceae bacterium]|nr:hypothetical protein [Chitinophagaceae bacterium]
MNGLNILQRLYVAVFKGEAKRKLFSKALTRISPPELYPETDAAAVHFKHFGLIGDIIYAIPAMKALAGTKKIHLHLQINQDSLYSKGMKHHNRGKILTEKSV